MKQKLLSIPTLFCAACFTLTSCQKDYNASTDVETISELVDLFTALRPTPQNLSVTAGREQVITGASGTMLHFYPNSFKDKNGHIITSGTVNLQLTEMYKPGDMIANCASTSTVDGFPLQSSGQINVSATMNGEKVYANKYGVAFKQTGTQTPMALYYGNANSDNPVVVWNISEANVGSRSNGGVTGVGTGSGSSWIPGSLSGSGSWLGTGTGAQVDTSTGGNSGSGGSGSGGSGGWTNNGGGSGSNPYSLMYIFDTCTHLDFVNCDHFMGSNYQLTNMNITLQDESYTRTNAMAFLVMPSANCVMKGSVNKGKVKFSQIPMGLDYKIIIMCNNKGSYSASETSGTISDGQKLTMTMAATTIADLTSKLHAL